MSVKQRLRDFIKYKRISISAFCRAIGVSTAYVNSMRKSIQPDKIERIALKFPELNTGWLLTGGEEMLKNEKINFKEDCPECLKMKDRIIDLQGQLLDSLKGLNDSERERDHFKKCYEDCLQEMEKKEVSSG